MAKVQIKRRKATDRNSRQAVATAPVRGEKDYPDYEVSDAYHTIMRAGGFAKDKKMMQKVRAHAGRMASENRDLADRADRLAKTGRISDEQMEKLKKMRPLAKGNEGDGHPESAPERGMRT